MGDRGQVLAIAALGTGRKEADVDTPGTVLGGRGHLWALPQPGTDRMRKDGSERRAQPRRGGSSLVGSRLSVTVRDLGGWMAGPPHGGVPSSRAWRSAQG